MTRYTRLVFHLMVLSPLAFTPLASLAHGQNRGEAKASIGSANVTIEYGRPMLKGRDLSKMLQPGQMWRVGADAATTLETDAELDFGGTRVPKGKHILLAKLNEHGKWSLVVSKKAAFQYDPEAKIAEVPMETLEGKEPLEQLTIQLANKDGRGTIEIAWGTARLVASFAAAK